MSQQDFRRVTIVFDVAAQAGIGLPQTAITPGIRRTPQPKRYRLELHGR